MFLLTLNCIYIYNIYVCVYNNNYYLIKNPVRFKTLNPHM